MKDKINVRKDLYDLICAGTKTQTRRLKASYELGKAYCVTHRHIKLYEIFAVAKITAVKKEKIQEISEEDCLKEGIKKHLNSELDCKPNNHPFTHSFSNGNGVFYVSALDAFADLFDEIHGTGCWKSNPEVFVYDFKLLR